MTPLLELVRPLTSGESTARHVPSGLEATLDRQAAPPCMRTTLAAPDCREEMLTPKRLRHGSQVGGGLMSQWLKQDQLESRLQSVPQRSRLRALMLQRHLANGQAVVARCEPKLRAAVVTSML